MIAKLFSRRGKNSAPYQLQAAHGSYVFSSQADCTGDELISFLLDLHIYVDSVKYNELQKFPDCTELVQYSLSPETMVPVTRKIRLITVLKIGFIENSFESSNRLRECSDEVIIGAIKDLAILGNEVPTGMDHRGGSSSILPLDGILACVVCACVVL